MRAPAILTALFVPMAALATEEHECLIQPNAIISVSSATSGVMEDVLVSTGDVVEKGQKIAQLRADVERANADIARARATFEGDVQQRVVGRDLAAKKLERQQNLSQTNVVSSAVVEEAAAEAEVAAIGVSQAEFERRMAGLEQARADALLALRAIHAPMDGVIVEKLLWPGEYANDQAPIVTLAQLDPLLVKTFVPTDLFGRIVVGDTAVIRPAPPVGGDYDATVTAIDQVFDAASGTMGVRLKLPNPEGQLPAGLACRILFTPR